MQSVDKFMMSLDPRVRMIIVLAALLIFGMTVLPKWRQEAADYRREAAIQADVQAEMANRHHLVHAAPRSLTHTVLPLPSLRLP
jgi:hypothetical protein